MNLKENVNEIRNDKFFCFMMVNFIPNQKINTYIAETQNPYQSVILHNKGNAKCSKSTKSAAPNWELNMIIGPFNYIEEAFDFAKDWKSNSRGIPSRRKRGQDLAREKDLICWDKEVKSIIQIGKKIIK